MVRRLRQFWMAVAVLAVLASPHFAAAEPNEPECRVTDVVYDLAANLKITDTTMGAGDGTYTIGPGRFILRFDYRSGRPQVKFLAYDMRQSFTVVAKALMWTTRVTTDVKMHGASTAAIAEGTLEGHTVQWVGRANGVRSDGTMNCDGSMCGKFGAPPSGASEVHTGPTTVELKPFQFDREMKTFTMPFAVISESSSPKQRTLMSIAGREVKRSCVTAELASQ
jgi:hypothetical protein